MSETWKGDKDKAPKFGRKARAWLRRQIDRRLRTVKAEWGNAPFAAVVDWYLDWDNEDTPGPYYVTWKDEDEFRGGRFSSGAWVVLWDTVLDDLPRAIRNAERDAHMVRDSERFPSLDAWLAADMRGELKYGGAVGGMILVPDDVRERVKEVAQRRARLGAPRQCRCGATFKPDRRNATNCDECRAKNRAEKEAKRGRNRGSNGKA